MKTRIKTVLILGFTYAAIIQGLPSNALAQSPAYCGIYAMYGAARAVGANPGPFDDLIAKEYVSQRTGSTPDDLEALAETLGVKARTFHGLSIASLMLSDTPLILHVTSPGDLRRAQHWQLFLGWEDGRLRLADSSGNVYLEDPAMTLTRWDGVAIGVAPGSSRFPFASIIAGELLLRLGLFTLLACIAVFIFRGIKKRQRLQPKRATNPLGYRLVAACGATVLVVCLIVAGTSATSAESRTTINRFFNDFRPKLLDWARFEKMQPAPLLIDARYERDFAYGSVPGAINIPVNSDDQPIRALKRQYPNDHPIVVFCQSENCSFEDDIAQRLYTMGFDNIYTIHSGYVGWQKYQQTRPRKPVP